MSGLNAANTETEVVTTEALIEEQRKRNAEAYNAVWYAMQYDQTDADLRLYIQSLRENGVGDTGDQARDIEQVLVTRENMRKHPTYFRMASFLNIHKLAGEERPDPYAVWVACERLWKTEMDDGQLLSPLAKRLPWGDEEAKAYRRNRKGPMLPVLVARRLQGDVRQVVNGRLYMVVPDNPEYNDLVIKLRSLFDQALDSLLQEFERKPFVDIGNAVLWVARFFPGARMASAEHLEKAWRLIDDRWIPYSDEDKEDGGKKYFLFRASPEENLLLEDNPVGARCFQVLERAKDHTSQLWLGAFDNKLRASMLRTLEMVDPAMVLPSSSMFQAGAPAGYAMVYRENWGQHDHVLLLMKRGYDGRVCVEMMSPASALAQMCTTELNGFHPRNRWKRDLEEELRRFCDPATGAQDVLIADVPRLAASVSMSLPAPEQQ